jgi:hypothetical protein
MTANEMKFNFQLKYDSLFEFSAPAYDDRQISYILTEAQFRVFIKRYNPLGNKYQKGFEADEQRRRDLEQLIKPALYDYTDPTGSGIAAGVEPIVQSSQQGGVHPNGVFFDMPPDFLYAVEEAVQLQGEPKEAWVRSVKHDEYLANINNPYKKPYKDLVWRMDISRYQHAEGTSVAATSKRTELILPDGFSVDTYRLRYLGNPPSIVVDEFDPTNQRHCVLDNTLHREIVDEAVVIAQAAVKPDKYQIGISETERDD